MKSEQYSSALSTQSPFDMSNLSGRWNKSSSLSTSRGTAFYNILKKRYPVKAVSDYQRLRTNRHNSNDINNKYKNNNDIRNKSNFKTELERLQKITAQFKKKHLIAKVQ